MSATLPAAPTVVGVDVGGTAVKAVLVDAHASVLAEQRRPSPSAGPGIAARVVETIVDVVDTLAAGTATPITGIGLVVPGIVDEAAGVARRSGAFDWHNLPLPALVSERLGLPVAFGHDVRSGGLAEARLGAAQGCSDVVFIPIGTGISASLQIAGRPFAGGGFAGELGHVDVGHAERCVCGRPGCLEAIASASAISRRYRARSGRGVIGAEAVARLVAHGDPDARAVWDEAVDSLALALSWLAGVLAPETVIIGGGLSRAGDLLMTPLAERTEQRLTFQRRFRLLPAALGERAGCLGAALLALDAASGTELPR
ncbi:MAG TPA: ROK family protein [Acidimicrobiales bacterium]